MEVKVYSRETSVKIVRKYFVDDIFCNGLEKPV